MCQEKRDFLCSVCPFDKKCEEERTIQRHAFRYWNFGIIPPEGYKKKVGEFLRDHPSLFKGATPQ